MEKLLWLQQPNEEGLSTPVPVTVCGDNRQQTPHSHLHDSAPNQHAQRYLKMTTNDAHQTHQATGARQTEPFQVNAKRLSAPKGRAVVDR